MKKRCLKSFAVSTLIAFSLTGCMENSEIEGTYECNKGTKIIIDGNSFGITVSTQLGSKFGFDNKDTKIEFNENKGIYTFKRKFKGEKQYQVQFEGKFNKDTKQFLLINPHLNKYQQKKEALNCSKIKN